MFKQLKSYPTYQINKRGEVYSMLRCTVLTPHLSYGKPSVTLRMDGKSKTVKIVTLMLETYFKPEDTSDKIVEYLDGDQNNVSLDNLYLVENMKRGAILFYYPTGETKVMKNMRVCAEHCQANTAALKRNVTFNDSVSDFDSMRYTLTKDGLSVALISPRHYRELNEVLNYVPGLDEVVEEEVWD